MLRQQRSLASTLVLFRAVTSSQRFVTSKAEHPTTSAGQPQQQQVAETAASEAEEHVCCQQQEGGDQEGHSAAAVDPKVYRPRKMYKKKVRWHQKWLRLDIPDTTANQFYIVAFFFCFTLFANVVAYYGTEWRRKFDEENLSNVSKFEKP